LSVPTTQSDDRDDRDDRDDHVSAGMTTQSDDRDDRLIVMLRCFGALDAFEAFDDRLIG